MDKPPSQSTLVFICGPPAVGKMTVGLELSALTGIPLFHNHLGIEAVLPVFEFGSPAFNRLVGGLRDLICQVRSRASSSLKGDACLSDSRRSTLSFRCA